LSGKERRGEWRGVGSGVFSVALVVVEDDVRRTKRSNGLTVGCSSSNEPGTISYRTVPVLYFHNNSSKLVPVAGSLLVLVPV
jgi:hypothetical protein